MAGEVDLTVRAVTDGSIPTATAQVAALNAEVGKSAAATEQAAASELKGVAGLEALQAEMRAATAGASGLAAGEAAAAGATATFGAAVAGAAVPITLVATAITLAIPLFKAIWSALEFAGEAFGKMGQTAADTTPVLDAHGKVLEPLAPGYVKAAAAADQHTRALKEMAAGLVQATENMALADARSILYEASLHGAAASTEDFAKALKAMGLQAIESFDDVKAKGSDFITSYQFYLATQGPAAARQFAAQNKSALDEVESRYIKAGQAIPPALKEISDAIGLIPKAAADAAKSAADIEKLGKTIDDMKTKAADLSKALVENGKAFEDHSKKIEQDRQTAINAIDQTTAKTIAGLQEQVRQTQAAEAARTISATDANTKINQLIADEAKAKLDGYEAGKKVDEDAKKDQATLTEKYQSESKKRTEALNDANKALEDATTKQDALNKSRDDEVRALQTATPLLGQSKEFTQLLADVNKTLAENTGDSANATAELADQFVATLGTLPGLTSGLGGMASELDRVAASARNAAAALASLNGGGGGAAGGDGGGVQF